MMSENNLIKVQKRMLDNYRKENEILRDKIDELDCKIYNILKMLRDRVERK